MNRDEVNCHIITAIWGDSDITRALNGGEAMADDNEDPRNPVQKMVDAARLAVAMGKSTENLEWEEEIGTPAPKPAPQFVKSSEARFERVSAKIRELFGAQNMEVCEEMIEAARKLRDAERAAMLAEV
jgi:hypothetical protein